jgi:hypothetical protein
MSQLQVTGEAKIRDIQGPVVANSGVVTALDGDASQYVRGDGTLADFPTSTGGGSSVSYYLNSSVSQGTIGGVAYRQLGKTPISGAGTDIVISANGYIASYITDANDPALLEVPAGNFNCEFYFSVNSNAHNPFVYAEVYKYDGTTFTLIGSSQSVPEYLTNGTTLSPYYFAIPVAQTVLAITDRIAIRIYVNVDGRTVTLHTENNHLCQVVTTFSKGLTSLNNLTRQVQFFGTGTSGTDFNISSVTATHTFNLPVASAANTGKLSSTDWSTFNNKIAGTGTTNYLSKFTSASAIGNSLVYDNGTNVIIGNGTTDIQGRLQVTTSAGALLLNTDNINFAILFRNTSSSNKLWDISSFNNDLVFNEGGVGSRLYLKAGGDVGIGNTTPAYKLDVSGTGRFTGELRLESTITNGTFTYTLPAATGTLALTSQLTGGTVTSVGLSSATSGVTIGSSPITTSGTITLAIATASGSLNGLLSSTDWTTFNNKLSPATADATYVSLSANQTVGGFKTFTQAIKNEFGILLKHNFISGQIGYTGLGGYADGLTVQTSGSIFLQSLFFQSAGSYTYTFPASTGTIALTSNLSAYLPLAGGTLTGALTGTSATFSGKVLINTVTDVQGALQVNTNGGGLLVNADNSNFAILIRNTSSSNKLWDFSSFNNDFTINEGGVATRMYFQAGGNVGIGTTTPSATLSVVGAATFSSTLGTGGDITITKASAASFIANNTSASGKSYRLLSGDDGIFRIQNTGVLDLFAITSAGAGSFTSSVTANSGLTGTKVGYNTFDAAGYGVAIGYVAGSYGFVSSTGASSPLVLAIDGVEKMTIASTGAATFTSSGIANGTTKFAVTGAGLISSFGSAGSGTDNYIRFVGNANNFDVGITGTSWGVADAGVAYRLIVTQAGNVGIGTSTPLLTLANRTTVDINGTNQSLLVFSNGGAFKGYIYNDGTNMDYTATGTAGFGAAGAVLFNTAGVERARITSGGNVLVNNTSSVGSKLIVKSDGTTSASFACIFWDSASSDLMYVRSDGYGYLKASAWVYGSDLRMKENVSNVENGLDMVLKMKPKHFDYINGQKNNIGFVAQDIQKIIPQAVSVTNEETGMLGLKTDFLVPYIAKAVQELKLEKDTEIAELKAQIEELKELIKNK